MLRFLKSDSGLDLGENRVVEQERMTKFDAELWNSILIHDTETEVGEPFFGLLLCKNHNGFKLLP
ncbi:hypothetical protein AKJ42_03825, partial [candidate division MSBL1 archaeon SCGC-AAA261C02]